MRSIEVVSLAEGQLKKQGIKSKRRKGSENNITEWNDRLSEAITFAIQNRDRIWEKKSRPIPLKAKHRPVFVNTSGDPLTTTALQDAFQPFIKSCISRGVIKKKERFNLHGLKHRGITDGNGGGGHKSKQMEDHYNHSLPRVKPASE